MPDALLRTLDLSVRRRIDSLLAGDYRATTQGSGTELAQVRPYEPGDDVRRIDWNVTARTRQPHVRLYVAERALVSWLVLDVSPSMHFGTADRRKADVAEGVALAVGHLATRRGNRLGVLTFGTPGSTSFGMMPTRQGRAALLDLLFVLRRGVNDEGTPGTSLARALGRARLLARRRASLVVVSDFRGPRDWRPQLLELGRRHHVVAVEIRDDREQELPDVGELWLIDPETGRQLRVDTAARRLRERFATAAAEERDDLARQIRSTGVDHVVLSTKGDWLRVLARSLLTKRRVR
jgi:uncharacterized protein (DUF58 family)